MFFLRRHTIFYVHFVSEDTFYLHLATRAMICMWNIVFFYFVAQLIWFEEEKRKEAALHCITCLYVFFSFFLFFLRFLFNKFNICLSWTTKPKKEQTVGAQTMAATTTSCDDSIVNIILSLYRIFFRRIFNHIQADYISFVYIIISPLFAPRAHAQTHICSKLKWGDSKWEINLNHTHNS